MDKKTERRLKQAVAARKGLESNLATGMDDFDDVIADVRKYHSVDEITEVTKYSRESIYKCLRRYKRRNKK